MSAELHPLWINLLDKLGNHVKGIGTLLQQTASGFREQQKRDAEAALRDLDQHDNRPAAGNRSVISLAKGGSRTGERESE